MDLEELDLNSTLVLYSIFEYGEKKGEGICLNEIRGILKGVVDNGVIYNRVCKLEDKKIIIDDLRRGKYYRSHWSPVYVISREYMDMVSKFFSDRAGAYTELKI